MGTNSFEDDLEDLHQVVSEQKPCKNEFYEWKIQNPKEGKKSKERGEKT